MTWTRRDVEDAYRNWHAVHEASREIYPADNADDAYSRGLAAGYDGALAMVLRNDAVKPDPS